MRGALGPPSRLTRCEMIYLDDFESWDGTTGRAAVEREFNTKLPEDVGIRVAVYQQGSWDGAAFVLFKRGDRFYEVNASHCSCYGLEDQWVPEEVAVAEIVKRPTYLFGYDNEAIRKAVVAAVAA